MLRYCGVTSTSIFGLGELGHRVGGGLVRSSSACSSSLAASKSRSRIRSSHLAHAAADLVGMQEALAVVGRLGREPVAGQPVEEVGRRADRVGHPVLGDRRMDVHAADRHHGQVGREGLDVDRVGPLAVERVAGRRRRARSRSSWSTPRPISSSQVKQIRTGPVRDLGMLDEPGGRLHDHGHARLVVGAQQRRAVGGDERAADAARPARGCRPRGSPARVAGQRRGRRPGSSRSPAA